MTPPDDGAGSETEEIEMARSLLAALSGPYPYAAAAEFKAIGHIALDDALQAYDALREENARLREALEKHGKHLLGCGLFKRGDEWREGPSACTCGLSAALSSSQVTE